MEVELSQGKGEGEPAGRNGQLHLATEVND